MIVKTLVEFRRDRYALPLATRSIVIWYPSKDLRVIAASGVVTLQDMNVLIEAMRDETAPGFHAFLSLVDMSSVSHIDAVGFDRFVLFMKDNVDAFARVNLRSAYVHGSGNPMASAAVAGYSHILGSPFPTENFDSAGEGFAGLGFEEHAFDLARNLATLKAHAEQTYQVLGPLEEAILANIAEPSARRLSAALGLSTRTLQRELSSAHTTLTDEVRRVRVALACKLLLRKDRSMAQVTKEIGFATTKAFRSAFQREIGELPSTWRASQTK